MLIKILGDSPKKTETNDVIEDAVPIATMKNGNTLLIRNFNLYLLKMKNEHPKTVNAKKKADNTNCGYKLNVLKVSQAKLNIKIQERLKSTILCDSFIDFDENRLNPITSKLIFTEKI
jgi:hypothetical protein